MAGNLRLLKAEFGTGMLVDGSSDSIHSDSVFMNKQSFALSRGYVTSIETIRKVQGLQIMLWSEARIPILWRMKN